MEDRIVLRRRPLVLEEFGWRRVTLDNRIKDGLIPPPVSLGGILKGWPGHELEQIKRAMIAGATDDEIRELVRDLIGQRKITREQTTVRNTVTAGTAA